MRRRTVIGRRRNLAPVNLVKILLVHLDVLGIL
jgi:hypothetical protein